MDYHLCLRSAHLARILIQHCEKKRNKIDFHRFFLYQRYWYLSMMKPLPEVDEVYQDTQPDHSTTIFECLVSRISKVHSSIGYFTLYLNVFLFLLFLIRCLQNALYTCGHKNARTNVWKTEEKKEIHINTFSPPMKYHQSSAVGF